jgi:hypothetical protein
VRVLHFAQGVSGTEELVTHSRAVVHLGSINSNNCN